MPCTPILLAEPPQRLMNHGWGKQAWVGTSWRQLGHAGQPAPASPSAVVSTGHQPQVLGPPQRIGAECSMSISLMTW